MRAVRLLVALAVAVPLAGAGVVLRGQDRDPDINIAGGGTLPTSWQARTDKNRPLADANIVTMGDGLHVTLGPAVVLWRASDEASGGNYHVVATFTQTRNPRHPEAYGLFIGGSHLADAGNRYTYFLVRGDGKFLVKRRVAGDSTADVKAWTESDAIVKADSAGKATNELSIQVRGGTVSFRVNGKEVYSAKAAELDTQGIVGYRVNHNLDVHLSALGIHKS